MSGADKIQSVWAVDLDGDNTIDALSASSVDNDDTIAWYQNDGTSQKFDKYLINQQCQRRELGPRDRR